MWEKIEIDDGLLFLFPMMMEIQLILHTAYFAHLVPIWLVLNLALFTALLNWELTGVHIYLKFMFSKKATKIDEIFTVDLTLTT